MFGFFDLANPYFFKTAAELAGLPIHGPGHRPDWPLGLTDYVFYQLLGHFPGERRPSR